MLKTKKKRAWHLVKFFWDNPLFDHLWLAKMSSFLNSIDESLHCTGPFSCEYIFRWFFSKDSLKIWDGFQMMKRKISVYEIRNTSYKFLFYQSKLKSNMQTFQASKRLSNILMMVILTLPWKDLTLKEL